LEVTLVDVPLLHLVLRLLAVVTNKMRNVVTARPFLGSQIAVLEDITQTRCPVGILSFVVNELPIVAYSNYLRCQLAWFLFDRVECSEMSTLP
jgi:hypothetical protein